MLEKLKSGHLPIFLISNIAAVTNLLLPIVLVRLLSPSDIGLYKIFFLYSQALLFIIMSGGPLYSVYYWIGKKTDSAAYLQQSWLLTNIIGLLTLIIGIPLVILFPDFAKLPITSLILLLVASISISPSAFYGELITSQGRQLAGTIFNTTFEVIKAILFIVVAFIYRNIEAIFWTYALLFLFKNIYGLHLGNKIGMVSYKIDAGKMKDVVKYCFPISLAGTLSFFVDKVDMLLLSSRISTEDFAYYSMGCLIIPPLILLDMAVQKVLLPKLSSAYDGKNTVKVINDFTKAQSDIAILIIPAVFGLILFAAPTVEILFTTQYNASIPFLKVFALGYLAYIFPHDLVPRASGKTMWILKIYIIITPITLAAVYLMVDIYGAIGALATAIAFKFLPKLFGLLYSCQVMNWRFKDIFPYRHFIVYLLLSSLLSYLSLTFKPLFSSQISWFVITGPSMIILYSLSLISLKKKKII